MPQEMAANYEGVFLWTVFAVTLLGLLGWRWSYGWRAESMPAALAMIWIPLPYILSHAEALSGPRLPLDGVLLCYTAFAFLCLVPGVGRRLLAGARSAAAAIAGKGDRLRLIIFEARVSDTFSCPSIFWAIGIC